MKKFKLLVVALITVILLPFSVNAAKKEPINVYLFKGDGCGYCAAALEFFESIEKDYGDYFNLVEYEVWYSEENSTLMNEVASHFGEEINGVPYIVIGDKTFQGYAEEYNSDIIKAIKDSYESKDYVDAIKAVNGNVPTEEKDNSNRTTIIIIAVALVGFVALFYFARDNETEEVQAFEKKDETIVEEPKKEEVKKVTPKTSTKKTTAKKTTTKKTTTTKTSTSKKATTKKATTKAPAKKTTSTKKTTKK